VLGAKIEYAPTSIEVFKDKMENLYKFPPFLVRHLVEVAQNYRDGIFVGMNDNVEKLPRRLRFRCRNPSTNTGAPLRDTDAQRLNNLRKFGRKAHVAT